MCSQHKVLRGPPKKDPEVIIEAVRRIVRRLGVERAYVFGSYARGQADRWSDLDLLIVARTERPFVERYKDYMAVFDVHTATEVLVYTPEEFDQMVESENPFIERVLEEGVPLHEEHGR